MLIAKSKIDIDDVATFKLSNGDELVARVVSKSLDGDFVINKPHSVIPSQQGVGLYPSLITADPESNLAIGHNHIMMCAPTVPEIEAHYIKMTTGVVVAPKQSIIV